MQSDWEAQVRVDNRRIRQRKQQKRYGALPFTQNTGSPVGQDEAPCSVNVRIVIAM